MHPTVERSPDGRGQRLTCQLRLATPLDQVFGFFADAHNLEAITPPFLRFSVLTPAPIPMHEGTLIDYRLRLRGVPIRWRTEITAWDPPRHFRDEQLRGPYRWWRHDHFFEECEGGTLARDQVDYGVPGGALVDRLLVRADVVRIFEHRSAALVERFGLVGNSDC